ncbi:MAG: NnrS family protein [Gammaproteobacteria bacterium]
MVVLQRGFRIFFIGAGALATVAMVGWVCLLEGYRWPGAPENVIVWHAHEMMYGFGGAAVAGFLLTAVPEFTKTRAVQGLALAIVFALWLAARLSAALPSFGLAVIGPWFDVAFFLALAVAVGHPIVATRTWSSSVLPAIVLLLAGTSTMYALATTSTLPWPPIATLAPAPHLFVLLIVVMGGRIIPAFTRNWLRARGVERVPVSSRASTAASIGATVLVALLDVLGADGVWLGVASGLAFAVHSSRLSGWCGWATWRSPLLLVLHVGYAWIPVGYLIAGLAAVTGAFPASASLHAFTIGAIGTMILAVMTRVGLGHSGRALEASRPILAAYAAVTAAAVLRLAAPFSVHYHDLLVASGSLWAIAFATFSICYWPILSGPRVDEGD